MRFAECGLAGLTAPALNTALTEVTESLAGSVLASGTGHGFSPLDFWRKKPLNLIEVWMRASSASELAPPTAGTGSGALIVSYVLGWWLDRDFHGLTVSEANCDCDRHADFILSESPVAAGLSHLTPNLFLMRLCCATKVVTKQIFVRLVATNHRALLNVQIIRVSADLLGILPKSPKKTAQSLAISITEKRYQLPIRSTVAMFKQGIYEFSLIAINQAKELSNSLFTPARNTVLRILGSGRFTSSRTIACGVFCAVRQLQSIFWRFALNSCTTNPYSVGHHSYPLYRKDSSSMVEPCQ
jgi:hypothetical protein